jgi:hypothetical protein
LKPRQMLWTRSMSRTRGGYSPGKHGENGAPPLGNGREYGDDYIREWTWVEPWGRHIGYRLDHALVLPPLRVEQSQRKLLSRYRGDDGDTHCHYPLANRKFRATGLRRLHHSRFQASMSFESAQYVQATLGFKLRRIHQYAIHPKAELITSRPRIEMNVRDAFAQRILKDRADHSGTRTGSVAAGAAASSLLSSRAISVWLTRRVFKERSLGINESALGSHS